MNKLTRIKNKFRKEIKSIRRATLNLKRSEITKGIITNLFSLNYSNNKLFSGYIATDDEVDISEFLIELMKKNKTIGLPKVINENEMIFCKWDGDKKSLIRNTTLNFYEPTGNEEIIPQVVITPLLAFDKEKNRLGYGKGYYDNYFKQHPEPLKIGIAIEQQEIDKVPMGSHDKKLDIIVTDKRVIV